MSKLFLRRLLFGIIFLFALSTATQFHGPRSIANLPAPMLEIPTSMAQGHTTARLCGGTGGVLFDQTARPVDGLVVTSLELDYLRGKQDGERVRVTLNGQESVLPAFDWLLIPAAHVAESSYFSDFTLFGAIDDDIMGQLILNNEGWLMNYHPALINTLAGLRTYELDVLMLFDFSTDLPKEDGHYLLGNGETFPDLSRNQQGLNAFWRHWDDVENELGVRHRSWIITDFKRDLRFSAQNKLIDFTAEPYVYLWRFKSDRPDYDGQQEEQRIRTELEAEWQSQQAQNPGLIFGDWVIEKLIQTVADYEQNYMRFMTGTIDDIIACPDDACKRQLLERYDPNDLYQNLMIPLLWYMDQLKIDPLWDFSERISARTDLLQNINPAVWDAGVKLMNYSAFFRYCRTSFPEVWIDFLAQLAGISPQPSLQTGTALFETTNQAVQSYLAGHAPFPPTLRPFPEIHFVAGDTAIIALDPLVNDPDDALSALQWEVVSVQSGELQMPVVSVRGQVLRSMNKNPMLKTTLSSWSPQRQDRISMVNGASRQENGRIGSGLAVNIDQQNRNVIFTHSGIEVETEYQVVIRVRDTAGLTASGAFAVHVLPTHVDADEEEMRAFSCSLRSNYPNPFNPQTTITFTLNQSARVELNIYNLLGRCINTLMSGHLEAGMYSRLWDGMNAAGEPSASGCYWVELMAESGSGDMSVERRKMVLMR